MRKDLYDVLGVDKKASKSDIKKAYYQLAKKYHPDANPGDETAQKRFAEISEAYETLSDDQTRARYDAGGGQPGGGFGGFQDGGFQGFQGQNPDDIFSTLNDMFGGAAFGGRGGNAPRRGADVQTELQISFDEAVRGTSRKIRYQTRIACDDCGGSGSANNASPSVCPVCRGSGVETMSMPGQGYLQYQTTCRKCGGEGSIITDPCTSCRGRGVVRTEREVTVDIPPGIEDNMDIRLLNEGHAGEKGGPSGSVYVRVRVLRSKDFRRDGPNIHSEVDVSLAQAVLGGAVFVKGIHGDVNLKVKPGTQSGQVTRLPNRGMPKVNKQTQRGHHFVEFKVRVPEGSKLTPRQKELMLEWAREEGDHGKGTVNGLEAQSAVSDGDDDGDDDNGGGDGGDDAKSSDSWFGGSWFGGGGKDKKSKNDDQAAEAK